MAARNTTRTGESPTSQRPHVGTSRWRTGTHHWHAGTPCSRSRSRSAARPTLKRNSGTRPTTCGREAHPNSEPILQTQAHAPKPAVLGRDLIQDRFAATDARFMAAKLIPRRRLAHELAEVRRAELHAQRDRVTEPVIHAGQQLVPQRDISQPGIADRRRASDLGAQRRVRKSRDPLRIVIALSDGAVVKRRSFHADTGTYVRDPRGRRPEIVVDVCKDVVRPQIIDDADGQLDFLLALVQRYVV